MAPAAPKRDYYMTLEVSPDATHEVLKASYRRLALLHHPDKNRGSKASTATTQLINAAWEVLGDSIKRSEYDRLRPLMTASFPQAPNAPKPAPPRPTSPKPAPRPQPSAYPPPPPPQPDTTAQDDAKARAESLKKRQEWLNWEKLQEQSIRQCQNTVKPLKNDIAALKKKISENRQKIAGDVPYWFNIFASLSTRLSEKEKSALRREILDADAAIRIKQGPLETEQSRLEQLKDELVRRKEQEERRSAAEKWERERRERIARQKAEAERIEKEQKERLARQKAEAERIDKERRERLAREHAEAEARQAEWARQRAAREAREELAREGAAKAEATKQAAFRKVEEEWRKTNQEWVKRDREPYVHGGRTQQSTTSRSKNQAKTPSTTTGICTHRGWWDKVEGRQDCRHCTRPLYKFAEKCPGCGTIACASCRRILKAGGTPRIDNSHGKSQGNQRAQTRYCSEYD